MDNGSRSQGRAPLGGGWGGGGELTELTLPKIPTNPHFMKMIIVKQ